MQPGCGGVRGGVRLAEVHPLHWWCSDAWSLQPEPVNFLVPAVFLKPEAWPVRALESPREDLGRGLAISFPLAALKRLVYVSMA